MNEGWKCPVCHRGVAPGVASCNHGYDGGVIAHPIAPGPYPLSPGWNTCSRCGTLFVGAHACWTWVPNITTTSQQISGGTTDLTGPYTVTLNGGSYPTA